MLQLKHALLLHHGLEVAVGSLRFVTRRCLTSLGSALYNNEMAGLILAKRTPDLQECAKTVRWLEPMLMLRLLELNLRRQRRMVRQV